MPAQKISADPLLATPSANATVAGVDPTASTTTNYRFGLTAMKKWLGVNILRPPYRPEDYGAAFDGTTNDTTAFSNMFTDITAAGGGDVRLPSGTTRVNAGTLNIPTRCSIRGQGRQTTTIRRASGSNGVLLDASGADTNTRRFHVILEDFLIHGNDGTGPAFRSVYASEHNLRNVYFYGNLGPAMQIVETWDSNYDFLFAEWCGHETAESTDNGSTIGNEVLQLWGSIAATGFGSSADSNNNLNFNNLRLETFARQAVSIRKGPSGAGVANAQLRFTGCKFESGSTWASQYMLHMSADVRNVIFRDTYLACISVTGTAATAGTCSFVNFIPSAGCMFSGGTVFLASSEAAKLNSVFSCFTNAQNRIERIWMDGSGPTGGSNPAMIKIAGGSNVPYAQVEGMPGTTVTPALNASNVSYAATI